MRFVAFLRGINVGGRIVKKEVLKETLDTLGLRNATTYRQSGNIIFDADTTDSEKLRLAIQEKLKLKLGFETAVFIRSIPQLQKIFSHRTIKGQNEDSSSLLVTMLLVAQKQVPLSFPTIIPNSTAQIMKMEGNEIYSITHGGGEGALPNSYIESKLKTKATTRNMNVIGDILEKYS